MLSVLCMLQHMLSVLNMVNTYNCYKSDNMELRGLMSNEYDTVPTWRSFPEYKLGVHSLAGLEVFVSFLGTSLAREAESQTHRSLGRLPYTSFRRRTPSLGPQQTRGLLLVGIFP